MCSEARLFAFALAAALASTASVARADAESDAKDLFTRGRELRAQGNCIDAVQDFRKAAAIFPGGLGSLRNIAECEEELGHFASARRAWLDLKRALLTTSDKKYEGWDADADVAAKRLAPKIAKLVIDVRVVAPEGELAPSPSNGLHVLVNGEALAPDLVGTELERDPGTYRVRVERPNGAPIQQSVTVAAGQSERVALRVPFEGERAAPPPGAPPAPEDPNAKRRLAGWITLGVGGAALVGATIALAVRQSALGDVDDACPSHAACDPSLQSTVDRGKTAAVLTNVLGVVGLLAAGTGATLILLSPPPRSSTGVVVHPTVGGVGATWRFE